MKLIATKPLRFGGKDLQPGDEFEASENHGRTLKAIGKAADIAVGDAQPTATKRPAYQTRRLKAKD